MSAMLGALAGDGLSMRQVFALSACGASVTTLNSTLNRNRGRHAPAHWEPPSQLAQTWVMDRDRDETGRARNARPRDALGRPLPHGAVGIPRQPEGRCRSAQQTLDEAQQLLDAGRPFHAHEVFEDAWKAARETADARLWQGLAQLAVGYTHQLRGNRAGADRVLRRAAAALAHYADADPYDIDVRRLCAWAEDPQDRKMPSLQGPRQSKPPSRSASSK